MWSSHIIALFHGFNEKALAGLQCLGKGGDQASEEPKGHHFLEEGRSQRIG